MTIKQRISINQQFVGELEVYDEGLQLKRRPWGYLLLVHGGVTIQTGCSILMIEGQLELARPDEGGRYAGSVLSDPRPYVLSGGSNQLKLRVDVDERTLHEFELARLANGSREVRASFVLSPLILRQDVAPGVGYCKLDCRLPVSRWSELLQHAGYSLTLLHRFPPVGLSQRHGDRYRSVVEAFQRAERHLIENRPTDAVEHCRNTLNLLARVACRGKEFDDNAMRELLRKVSDAEKGARLMRMWKALMTVTNDPHHPRVESETYQSIAHDADEARFVLSVTAATLEFIGLLISRDS